MGPTSAGKTTIGKLFVEDMRAADIPSIHYDGDEIRSFFGDALGFRPEDRLRAVSTCVHPAITATEAGLNVVVSALTANDDARNYIKENGQLIDTWPASYRQYMIIFLYVTTGKLLPKKIRSD